MAVVAPKPLRAFSAAVALACAIGAGPARGQVTVSPEYRALSREIFKQLIEINTTHEHGSTTPAAEAIAARLRQAGIPPADIQLLGPEGSKNKSLVARIRGSGTRKPIVLLAHLDVVEAKREDWSMDPFVFTERDGFFYGRGTTDIKDGAAILTAALIRLTREGAGFDRDVILALTAGEEGGGDHNGVAFLLEHHRPLLDAAYIVNMDAGDPQIRNGKRILRTVQASEKVVASFRLETTNPGGHSSLPRKDNAIYRLAAGLVRLGAFDWPARVLPVTREYFARMAALEQGTVAGDMRAVSGPTPDPGAIVRLSANTYYNAQLRTTCVATMLEGGHAQNALPQKAGAIVNCRMLPGENVDSVERTIARVVADTGIAVRRLGQPRPAPDLPLVPEGMSAVDQVTARLWPGVPVVPVLETGATDGLFFRALGVPVLGVSGVFVDVDDVRAHGRDERVGVQEYYEGAEYIYQLIREIAVKGAKITP